MFFLVHKNDIDNSLPLPHRISRSDGAGAIKVRIKFEKILILQIFPLPV